MPSATTKSTPTFKDPDLSASLEQALDAVTRAGDTAEALIDAWVERKNAAAVSAIAERGSGKARKAARRAVNVLKARGVTIPDVPKVATLKTEDPEIVEAWMISPDAAGSLLLCVASRTRLSRHRACFVVLNDAYGVLQVDVKELSQSQLKDTLTRSLPARDLKLTKVPAEWARARIATARARNKESGAIEPLGLATAESLLAGAPETPPEHPFDAEGLELSLDDAKQMATDSVKLHNTPEFRGWLPPRPAVDELLRRVGTELTPGEEPGAEKLQALLAQHIRGMTDTFFTPEERASLCRRMKDAALAVLQRAGESPALEVVAAMTVIEKAGLVTDPPSEIAFLRGFFDKAIAMMLAQGGGRLRIPVARAPGAPAQNHDHDHGHHPDHDHDHEHHSHE